MLVVATNSLNSKIQPPTGSEAPIEALDHPWPCRDSISWSSHVSLKTGSTSLNVYAWSPGLWLILWQELLHCGTPGIGHPPHWGGDICGQNMSWRAIRALQHAIHSHLSLVDDIKYFRGLNKSASSQWSWPMGMALKISMSEKVPTISICGLYRRSLRMDEEPKWLL